MYLYHDVIYTRNDDTHTTMFIVYCPNKMLILAIIALKLQQNSFNMIHVHSENIKMEILTKNTLVFVRCYSFFKNKIDGISRKWLFDLLTISINANTW